MELTISEIKRNCKHKSYAPKILYYDGGWWDACYDCGLYRWPPYATQKGGCILAVPVWTDLRPKKYETTEYVNRNGIYVQEVVVHEDYL